MKFLLKTEVRRCFSYLFEKWGFEFVDLENDYDGNIVIAQSDTLKIRFIRDRADFFLDISCAEESAEWIGFYKIVDQLCVNGKLNIQYKYSNKMGAVSQLLRQYLLKIQEFLLR